MRRGHIRFLWLKESLVEHWDSEPVNQRYWSMTPL